MVTRPFVTEIWVHQMHLRILLSRQLIQHLMRLNQLLPLPEVQLLQRSLLSLPVLLALVPDSQLKAGSLLTNGRSCLLRS